MPEQRRHLGAEERGGEGERNDDRNEHPQDVGVARALLGSATVIKGVLLRLTALAMSRRSFAFVVAFSIAETVQAGVHFPSDLVGGWLLADAIVAEIKKSAAFQARLKAVQAEVTALAR